MVNVVYAIRPVLCCDYNGVSNERPDNILAEHIRRAFKLERIARMYGKADWISTASGSERASGSGPARYRSRY
jgi:hypothetical protein